MDRLIPIYHGGIVYLNAALAKEENAKFIYLTTCTLSILAFSQDRIDIPKRHALCQLVSNLPFQWKSINNTAETTTIITENQLHGQTVILPINILK